MVWTERTVAALNMAYTMHNGQKDKAGAPYIFHAYRVADQDIIPANRNLAESLTVVALLHDVVEDTDVTIEGVNIAAAEYGLTLTETEISWLDALTKRDTEMYIEYIKRVSECPEALRIKLADLADNLDETRGYRLPASLRDRYETARKCLWAKLDEEFLMGEQ